MNILAIEASTEACSAALLTRGAMLERFEHAPRRHTELLLPMVHSLLDETGMLLSGLDAVAYGRGPGSFTGVRIAACVAQGLAISADLGVIAVSTLAALAAKGATAGEQVLAAFDARMGEVYLGSYRIAGDGLAEEVSPEQLAAPCRLLLPDSGGWVGLGGGWRSHGDAIVQRLGASLSRVDDALLPGAAQVAQLAAARGGALAPERALPSYLRREVTTPRRRAAVPD